MRVCGADWGYKSFSIVWEHFFFFLKKKEKRAKRSGMCNNWIVSLQPKDPTVSGFYENADPYFPAGLYESVYLAK